MTLNGLRRRWNADRVRNSLFGRLLDGAMNTLLAFVPWRSERSRLLARSIAVRRFAYTPFRLLARLLWQGGNSTARFARYREQQVGWDKYGGAMRARSSDATTRLTTSLVLREPTKEDKGILYISFEYNLLRLVADGRLRDVMNHFYVVCATSWSPTDFACLSCVAGISADPLFLGISNDADVRAFKVAHPIVRSVSQLASDWIDPGEFAVTGEVSRDIDIVMVAHWAKWKRHWLLFQALTKLPPQLNVVLVGRDVDGRTANSILDEARGIGVRQQVTAFTDIDASAVRGLLARSRVAVTLSAREGSCVAIAEALAADCPVACLTESHIGALRYVNDRTGLRVPARSLHRGILKVLQSREVFSPRSWYSEHSGCWLSSRKLEGELNSYSESMHRHPSKPMAPLKWSYVPTYANPSDVTRLSAAREFLETECGVELVEFVPPMPSDSAAVLDASRPGAALVTIN